MSIPSASPLSQNLLTDTLNNAANAAFGKSKNTQDQFAAMLRDNAAKAPTPSPAQRQSEASQQTKQAQASLSSSAKNAAPKPQTAASKTSPSQSQSPNTRTPTSPTPLKSQTQAHAKNPSKISDADTASASERRVDDRTSAGDAFSFDTADQALAVDSAETAEAQNARSDKLDEIDAKDTAAAPTDALLMGWLQRPLPLPPAGGDASRLASLSDAKATEAALATQSQGTGRNSLELDRNGSNVFFKSEGSAAAALALKDAQGNTALSPEGGRFADALASKNGMLNNDENARAHQTASLALERFTALNTSAPDTDATLTNAISSGMLGTASANNTPDRRDGDTLTSNRLSIEASGLPSTIARPPTGFEPNATAKTSPAAEFQLNTGPGQDDFAQTFALQIKDMNRSGLQEATLHLHPADLGSIAVQISLDGAQAQVNFSAERPETRELLQHHMGDLARALQDAGLGFSGSDVRDQSSRNGGNNGQAFSQEQAFSQSIRLSNDAARNAEAVGLTPFAANSNTATSSIANGRLDLFA